MKGFTNCVRFAWEAVSVWEELLVETTWEVKAVELVLDEAPLEEVAPVELPVCKELFIVVLDKTLLEEARPVESVVCNELLMVVLRMTPERSAITSAASRPRAPRRPILCAKPNQTTPFRYLMLAELANPCPVRSAATSALSC